MQNRAWINDILRVKYKQFVDNNITSQDLKSSFLQALEISPENFKEVVLGQLVERAKTNQEIEKKEESSAYYRFFNSEKVKNEKEKLRIYEVVRFISTIEYDINTLNHLINQLENEKSLDKFNKLISEIHDFLFERRNSYPCDLIEKWMYFEYSRLFKNINRLNKEVKASAFLEAIGNIKLKDEEEKKKEDDCEGEKQKEKNRVDFNKLLKEQHPIARIISKPDERYVYDYHHDKNGRIRKFLLDDCIYHVLMQCGGFPALINLEDDAVLKYYFKKKLSGEDNRNGPDNRWMLFLPIISRSGKIKWFSEMIPKKYEEEVDNELIELLRERHKYGPPVLEPCDFDAFYNKFRTPQDKVFESKEEPIQTTSRERHSIIGVIFSGFASMGSALVSAVRWVYHCATCCFPSRHQENMDVLETEAPDERTPLLSEVRSSSYSDIAKPLGGFRQSRSLKKVDEVDNHSPSTSKINNTINGPNDDKSRENDHTPTLLTM